MVSLAAMKRPIPLRIFALLIAVVLGLAPLRADVRTLTDKQGRSIKADVLSVENGKVKIKRDDGQIFELPLDSLSEQDQSALREWAAKAAAQIPPGAVTVELSRGVFSSTKSEDTATITTEEKWGYSVTVTNHGSKPIENLKFDYVLFVKPDLEPGKDARAAALKRSTGSNTLPLLAIGAKPVFRTDSIKIYKQKLKPGWIWGKTGNSEMIRDTLHGIWLKAYVGNQLVAEICSPEALMKTEKGP